MPFFPSPIPSHSIPFQSLHLFWYRMSQPHLQTIDFLGIQSPMASSFAHQQLINTHPSTQSHLGKIKPHMLQRLLSHTELSHQCLMTTERFPRRSTGSLSNTKEDHRSFALDTSIKFSEAPAARNFKPSANPSSSQLTIFYNGGINVYDGVSAEKAEAIIMLAAGNGNALQQIYPGSDQCVSVSSTTSSNMSDCLSLSERLRKSLSSPAGLRNANLETSDAQLPMARKFSLQRFLQKRKDRIKRVVPYTT